jgi:hypothetical protein
VVVPCIRAKSSLPCPTAPLRSGSWSRQGARGETFGHAQLMAQAEALRQAKPAIIIGSITDEMRAAVIEKLIAEHSVVALRPLVTRRRSRGAHCSPHGHSRAGGERSSAYGRRS